MSTRIPPEGVPVFRFDDGWVWTRVPRPKSLRPWQICFQLFDTSWHPWRPMLLVSTGINRSSSLSQLDYIIVSGRGELRSASTRDYRGRVLPLWRQVLNQSNLHSLVQNTARPAIVCPRPLPEAWIDNAKRLQPELEALVAEGAPVSKQAMFLERVFENAHAIPSVASKTSTFHGSIAINVKANILPFVFGFYVRVAPPHHPEGTIGWAHVEPAVPTQWFRTLSDLVDFIMKKSFFVPASQMEDWVQKASFPGELLIDFSAHDLLCVRHPVVDVDAEFVPWAEAYVSDQGLGLASHQGPS